jgi:PAS domain S-box-containing protein
MAPREFAFGAPTVHDLMVALAGAGTIDDVAAEILDRGAAFVGAVDAHLSVVIRPGWRREFVDIRLRRSGDHDDDEDRGGRPIALDTPLSRAMVTQREQQFEHPDQYRAAFPHLAAHLEAVGAQAALTTPLRRTDGEVIGALTFGFAARGPVAPPQRAAAALVAEQSAVALDRAVLLHREREGAMRALRLHRAGTELAAVSRHDELAAVLWHAGREALDATRCFAYELSSDAMLQLVSTADAATSAYAVELPPGTGNPARDAVVLGGPVVVEHPDQFAARYRSVLWPAEHAVLALPLQVGARTVGVLVVSYDHARRFTPEHRSLAMGLAEQAALALDRTILHQRAESHATLAERERDRLTAITSSLQDGLFTSDSDGLILDANDRFCEITGFPRDVVLGAKPPYPWWPEADEEAVGQFIRHIVDRKRVAGERPPEFEVVFRQPDGGRIRGLLAASVLRGPTGDPIGAVATVKDVTKRVQAERRLRVLYGVTAGLTAARTTHDVARATVDEAVIALRAVVGAFVCLGAGAEVVHARAGARIPDPPDPDALASDPRLREAMRSGAIVSAAAPGELNALWIPVLVQGEAAACIALAFERAQLAQPEDLALYTAIAQQCGQALERAQADDAEHRARVAAERSGDRTRRLQEATAALSIASEPLDVARVVTRYAAQLVASDGVALFAMDHDQNELVLIDNGVLDASAAAAQVVRVPLDAPMSLADAARTQQAVWIHDRAEWRARYPHGAVTLSSGMSAIVVLPLVTDGRTLGVLAMVFRDPLVLDDDDRSLLYTLGDLAAHALHRAAVYAQERTVARTLQQSLLPRTIEVTDRCRVAVRYEPAVDQLAVGGDWYDALVLEPERLAVMVGDVVGRGLSAAASMGQLRSALGALAVRRDRPGVVLDMLDRFAERIDGGEAATVAFAVLDTVCGTMHYACAGHPPPLLLEPGAAPRFLEDGRSWPLGIGQRGRTRPDATVRLRPGSAIVFYTDGLVERRKVSLDDRLTSLAAAAAAGPFDDPSVLCDRLFDALLDDEPRDDVAALGLVYDPALAPLAQWTFPAEARCVRDARGLVRRWLARHDIDATTAFDIVLSTDEACTNAIEHGSQSEDDEVSLTLAFDPVEGVVITVTDTGSWVPRASREDRGHGLVLMRGLMSAVELTTTADGTTVRMSRRVTEPKDAAVASSA